MVRLRFFFSCFIARLPSLGIAFAISFFIALVGCIMCMTIISFGMSVAFLVNNKLMLGLLLPRDERERLESRALPELSRGIASIYRAERHRHEAKPRELTIYRPFLSARWQLGDQGRNQRVGLLLRHWACS